MSQKREIIEINKSLRELLGNDKVNRGVEEKKEVEKLQNTNVFSRIVAKYTTNLEIWRYQHIL